jgi:hypothetical protein
VSYFEYTKSQLKELADAYEDLVDELGVVYYSQDGDAIDAAQARVETLREELGIPYEWVTS